MPSGVEHLKAEANNPTPRKSVLSPVMPSGVEHYRVINPVQIDILVLSPVMPSGVEHLAQQNEANECFSCYHL